MDENVSQVKTVAGTKNKENQPKTTARDECLVRTALPYVNTVRDKAPIEYSNLNRLLCLGGLLCERIVIWRSKNIGRR